MTLEQTQFGLTAGNPLDALHFLGNYHVTRKQFRVRCVAKPERNQQAYNDSSLFEHGDCCLVALDAFERVTCPIRWGGVRIGFSANVNTWWIGCE